LIAFLLAKCVLITNTAVNVWLFKQRILGDVATAEILTKAIETKSAESWIKLSFISKKQPFKSRIVARKSSIERLYVCIGGLDIENLVNS